MRLSSVYGIMDRGGGVRVVVTDPLEIWAHVGEGETLYDPDLVIMEPVIQDGIPGLIEKVLAYVAEHRRG